jgi:hypothetical protein
LSWRKNFEAEVKGVIEVLNVNFDDILKVTPKAASPPLKHERTLFLAVAFGLFFAGALKMRIMLRFSTPSRSECRMSRVPIQ